MPAESPAPPGRAAEILYAMLKPPPDVAAAIDALRRRCAIPAGYGRDRLHVTVRPLGDIGGVAGGARGGQIAALAAIEIDMAPFRLALDRLDGKALIVGEGARAVAALRRAIEAGLAAHGELPAPDRFDNRPHLSLDYRGPRGAVRRIAPIVWTVRGVRLVGSLHGRGVHVDHGCIPFRPRQLALL